MLTRLKNLKYSLKSQMLFQYISLVLVCMLLIPALVSWFIDMRFRTFSENILAEERREIVLSLVNLYEYHGNWDGLEPAASWGDLVRPPILAITVFDSSGGMVKNFKLRTRRGGGNRRIEELLSNDKECKLKLLFDDIIIDGRKVGTVRFSVLPFNDSREGVFIRGFLWHLRVAVGFMLLAAVFFAYVMAGKISRPVLAASKRAHEISLGDYTAKSSLSSNITEIQTLIDSMDKLGYDLSEQERLRKRLMSDIAHELRSPISIIKSHLEAFWDGVWTPTPDRIKLTVEEVNRLSLLVAQVEKLSLIESQGVALSLTQVDLSAVLCKVATSFDPVFINKGVALERDIAPDITAFVDVEKIRQAVQNLISNSLRYSDSGCKVVLSAKSDGKTVEISVKDNGIGIAEADIPNIFARFYRADESRARALGGMGIGLAIVKAVVTAHKGTVAAESVLGQGSIFTIKIPVGKSGDSSKDVMCL